MRVIINGIEKFPSFCGECFLMDGETCECSVPGVERTCNPYDGRYDDCPMSPLQTHGRLGDLDALAEYVHQQDDWLSETAIHAFCGILCKTPTIIPAEPKEEGET